MEGPWLFGSYGPFFIFTLVTHWAIRESIRTSKGGPVLVSGYRWILWSMFVVCLFLTMNGLNAFGNPPPRVKQVPINVTYFAPSGEPLDEGRATLMIREYPATSKREFRVILHIGTPGGKVLTLPERLLRNLDHFLDSNALWKTLWTHPDSRGARQIHGFHGHVMVADRYNLIDLNPVFVDTTALTPEPSFSEFAYAGMIKRQPRQCDVEVLERRNF